MVKKGSGDTRRLLHSCSCDETFRHALNPCSIVSQVYAIQQQMLRNFVPAGAVSMLSKKLFLSSPAIAATKATQDGEEGEGDEATAHTECIAERNRSNRRDGQCVSQKFNSFPIRCRTGLYTHRYKSSWLTLCKVCCSQAPKTKKDVIERNTLAISHASKCVFVGCGASQSHLR